ncbi:MAG: tetratricopeptide repeat protein, partial [Akkermansiaceae bacterium]
LGAANARITQYQRSLSQAQSTIKELTQERDDLRRERDTLVGILKQGDAKGVQKLISENMRLGRELKQSMDRLKLLEKDNGAAKDELIEARRDLAVAKSRILKYQQAQASHNVQIKTLERQLRDAEADLAAGGKQATPANQEEAKTLRSTIKRLLAAQSRRRTAEKLLWETYKKSGTKIPGMEKAYADVRNVEVELTAKEDEMLAARRPDGEFRNPNRVPLAHARAHGDALEQEVADHHKLVVRFFERGHFELARGVLLDSDERLPGYFPTLCNLGVVEVNTQNYLQAIDRFSEAITMKDTSSYAHYMLGYTHYLNHDWDASRNAFEQALRLNPENARTQFYLGNLAGAGKRYEQAEKHFNAAIQLDPTMADAYFNISVLYLQQKRKKEALEAYRKALDNGSKPDPKHEQLLAALR